MEHTKEWVVRNRDLSDGIEAHYGIYPKENQTAGYLICSLKSLGIANSTNHNKDGAYGQTSSEALTNARLIAAAPELLEALLVVQKHLSGEEVLTHPERLIDWVNEAIEKATN